MSQLVFIVMVLWGPRLAPEISTDKQCIYQSLQILIFTRPTLLKMNTLEQSHHSEHLCLLEVFYTRRNLYVWVQ